VRNLTRSFKISNHEKVGPKGRIIFDYDEFENEGYGVIDEEIDQALFQFFVSDYEDQLWLFKTISVENHMFSSEPSVANCRYFYIYLFVSVVLPHIK